MESFNRDKQHRVKMSLVVAAILIAAISIAYLAGFFGGNSRRLSAKKLRPVVTQQVTPMGDRLLYYDGTTLFCLSANGTEMWKYVLGPGAGFSVSDRLVAAWSGGSLHILDRNGRVTFNDRLADAIQFARAGTKYVAAITGDTLSPTLVIKDINGLAVDSEAVAYEGKVLLEVGFFENGDYLWSTALDVLGVAPLTVMTIYRVGAMNTGEVEMGEEITYDVVYSGKKLYVVNTRDIQVYDNRGALVDPFAKQLVYGWRLIDSVGGSGDATMLFAPVHQTGQTQNITELRVLSGNKKDGRYTLPDACVGAGIWDNTVFAFSGDVLYRADLSAQRFSALGTTIEDTITGYIGLLSNGVALVSCGDEVWAVTLP